MALNREQKRMLRRQGELGPDGQPVRGQRSPTAPAAERTRPAQFVREVRAELRKVAWPTRSETVNFSLVVLVTIVLLMAFVGVLDWVFARVVLELFDT